MEFDVSIHERKGAQNLGVNRERAVGVDPTETPPRVSRRQMVFERVFMLRGSVADQLCPIAAGVSTGFFIVGFSFWELADYLAVES